MWGVKDEGDNLFVCLINYSRQYWRDKEGETETEGELGCWRIWGLLTAATLDCYGSWTGTRKWWYKNVCALKALKKCIFLNHVLNLTDWNLHEHTGEVISQE